jgi:hypothetical protein
VWATATSFPLSKHIGGGDTASAFSCLHVYLQFTWEVGLSPSLVEFSSHCSFYKLSRSWLPGMCCCSLSMSSQAILAQVSGGLAALLVSRFNVKWRFSEQAGGVEGSKFCLFLVALPARCVSNDSPRFHFRRHAFCFLPLAAVLESLSSLFLHVDLAVPLCLVVFVSWNWCTNVQSLYIFNYYIFWVYFSLYSYVVNFFISSDSFDLNSVLSDMNIDIPACFQILLLRISFSIILFSVCMSLPVRRDFWI